VIRFSDMVRDEVTLNRLWEEITKFSRWTLFDGLDTKEVLAQRLADTNAPHWDIIEEDKFVGYVSIYADTLWSAVFHILFFDRRVRGRIEQVRKLCDWYLSHSQKVLLRTMLPLNHRTSIAQAQKMGFVVDGFYRAMAMQNGKLVDFLLLSYTNKQPVIVQEPEFDEYGEALLHFLNGGGHG
jgi:hypothetical protein